MMPGIDTVPGAETGTASPASGPEHRLGGASGPGDPTGDPGGNAALHRADPAVFAALAAEEARQRATIGLIASENVASRAVRATQASVLTDKYAEGDPGRRYYGGCGPADTVERLAVERLRGLFGAGWANVQPHSGCNANLAAMFALLQPGDTILGLDLACGGHLTHGARITLSGRWFRAVSYRVDPASERIDPDDLARVVRAERPRLIVAGGSAYPRRIDFAAMRAVADEVGAWLLADVAHYAGLIAAGCYPNPLPHAHVVTTTPTRRCAARAAGRSSAMTPSWGGGSTRWRFPACRAGR